MLGSRRHPHLTGQERLIVALDVPTHEQALNLVDTLTNVSFFKIGLQLLFAGSLFGLLEGLQKRRESGIFVDLKLSGDIGNTITELVNACMTLNVKFLTLVESNPQSITIRTLEAARNARGTNHTPRLLMVPLLSSLNEEDLRAQGIGDDPAAFIVERGKTLLQHGCDGLIVSGGAIKECRTEFPDIDIVSPGIRLEGSSADDHKRSTTPQQAILYGADYLVVGRPITKSPSPEDVAQTIINEIDDALKERGGQVADSDLSTAAYG